MFPGVRPVCNYTLRRTTTNRRFNDGRISVERHHHLGVEELMLLGDERENLVLRNLDMLSAEQTRIDGPCTRSYHRQGDTQCCQHDGNPSMDTKISNQYFDECDQRSTNRSP